MSLFFDQITFKYSRLSSPVFDDFSWQVPEGKTILLGPNGAGKSTLLSIGANFLTSTKGDVLFQALNPRLSRQRKAYRSTIGWMPQSISAVPNLKTQEQVAYAAWLKGFSRHDAWSAAHEALAMVGLAEHHDRKLSTLSGGQLRRVGLAQTLAHRPKVLLLDEPTVGLDPAQRSRFREILAPLSDEFTVLISTHQVDDLAELSETIVVLEQGVIRFEGSVSSFLDLAADAPVEKRAERAYSQLISEEF